MGAVAPGYVAARPGCRPGGGQGLGALLGSERGSAWIGNSPAIWRSHYCRPSSGGEPEHDGRAGRPWPAPWRGSARSSW
jgi:hypothetical protein